MEADRMEVRVQGARYMIRNRDKTFSVEDSNGMVIAIGQQDKGVTFPKWASAYVEQLLEDTDG